MLLTAKTLKANSSQVCTTRSRGVVWIKVTGAAADVEVDVALLISSSMIVAELLREFITSLVTAAENVSVNVTFMVEFISSPAILLWT